MKKLVFLSFAVALMMSITTAAQYNTNQGTDQTKNDKVKAAKMSGKTVRMSGNVTIDGRTFITDRDTKNWTISNPGAVQGHEGHHVTITAQTNPDKDEIRVVSLKMAKAEMKNATKKDEMAK